MYMYVSLCTCICIAQAVILRQCDSETLRQCDSMSSETVRQCDSNIFISLVTVRHKGK